MTRPTTVALPTQLDCERCAGTGEGMHERDRCLACRGRGYSPVDLVACVPRISECDGCGKWSRIVATDEITGDAYCAACLGIEDAMRGAGELDDDEGAA